MTKPTWAAPVLTEIYPDPNDKSIVAVSVQDCDEILDQNKILREQTQKSDWGRHIAQVPNVIITKWLNEEWAKGNTHLRPFTKEFNETVVKKKLQDPNYKYLLVSRAPVARSPKTGRFVSWSDTA